MVTPSMESSVGPVDDPHGWRREGSAGAEVDAGPDPEVGPVDMLVGAVGGEQLRVVGLEGMAKFGRTVVCEADGPEDDVGARPASSI